MTDAQTTEKTKFAAPADAEPDDRYDFFAAGIFYRQHDVYERNQNDTDQAAGSAEFGDGE